jgi:RNA polymerase primary sigma factor
VCSLRRATDEGFALALDDKYDDIKKLIDAGKEKGYLTYSEVNDLIPHDVHSPEDLDDLLTTIGTQGIDVLEGQPKLPSSDLGKKFEQEIEAGEDVELDLTPGALEKTNDPVRMYLREMGTVPLLTREGEVEIAKRIERGQLRVLKALSRSPIIIREIIGIGEDLERGVRSIKEIVIFDEEELTDEVLQNRLQEVSGRI